MSLDKCPTCRTGQFRYNNINACLCTHVAEAEVATEERTLDWFIKLIKEQPRVLHDGLINANQLIALVEEKK